MSFWTDIENEYNAVISSADSVAVKLANLVGIQTKAQAMTQLTAQLTALVNDGSQTTEAKVDQILALTGKA